MQRYFFLYQPYSVEKKVLKKGTETTETIYKRNCEARDEFINRKGKKAFEEVCLKDEKWAQLQDLQPPKVYTWVWKHFLNIWQGCGRDAMGNVVFTFQTINDYVECMKVPLTIQDKRMLLKMKAWAMNQIAELKE